MKSRKLRLSLSSFRTLYLTFNCHLFADVT